MADSVSLKEYVEMRLAAMETAVTKAETAAEKRFEGINEMRAMVIDAARQYMPRLEFETAHQSLVDKIDALQKMIWIGVGIVGALQFVVGALVLLWVRK
jgi:ElaB/YqjD/DUF883 family membrane-anchored ribosome-binding protein